MSETTMPSFLPAADASLPSARRARVQIAVILLVVSMASAAIGWFMYPYTIAYTRVKLDDSGMASATIERTVATAARWRALTFVTTPIAETVKVGLVAGLVFAIQWLADAEIPYVIALWIACWMEVVSTLRRGVSLLVLAMRGAGAIRHAEDLSPPLGLDLVLRSDSGVFIHTLASFVNPFDALIVGVLFWASLRSTRTRGGAAYVTGTVMCLLFAVRALLYKFSAI